MIIHPLFLPTILFISCTTSKINVPEPNMLMANKVQFDTEKKEIWAYDFKGNLVATPHIGGLNTHTSDKFKKNQSNLKEVMSKIWMDIIFVNINSNELKFDLKSDEIEEIIWLERDEAINSASSWFDIQAIEKLT